MKKQKEIHQEIEAYLQNEMSKNNRALFEKRLKNDVHLRDELNLHISLNNTLNKEQTTTFKESDLENATFKETKALLKSETFQNISKNINTTSNQYFKERNRKKMPKKRLYYITAIAATLVLLIGLSTFLNTSNTTLYKEYNTWNDLPSKIEKSDNQTINIETYYNKKAYTKIIDLLIDKEQNTHELIYLGASYFQLNKYKKAIEIFDKLIASNAIDNSKGYWYKMLIYLKQKDTQKTKELLATITQNKQNYNYQKAIEIIKKLED